MMNALSLAVTQALENEGKTQEANKAYLEFIKANFIIPIEKNLADSSPQVLFLKENDQLFLPVFSDMQWLDSWAFEIKDDIQVLKLSGVDLLKGIGDEVTVCLDIGCKHYKEFNASEIARMRSMVLKFFK